ncbi:MAG: DUF6502 family protein [Gammaproteobacteria bacterium]
MSDGDKQVVLQAFRLLLQPLVRILLRSGITWKEAAETCKSSFVEVATTEYGLHGRPTNISRVAIMTGIGRREVSRLRKLLGVEPAPDLRSMNSATRLLSGWYLDTDYTRRSGAPRDLEFEGAAPSFSTLARKYAPDTAPITMVRELQRVGAVEERDDGRLRVLKRYYMPLAMDRDALLRAGSVLRDLGDTVDYNLTRGEDDPTRFEGRATNAQVPRTIVAAYRAFLEEQGQGLLERVDEWLSRHEVPADSPRSQKTTRVGIGVYQIQDDER